ncbi:class I SAM-dependent methyltransferase [Mycobacterium sp. MYCO198283]|uniref:class I SAM-dependent methyltransferase n=1 Tax=Mycobacterium sp. MYCO198283 TaxID=2883505 RepID=UPI001E464193|nr:class I SAM-dependent methyltransferase [Mycobacterium sp. MYCO198283]MCG5431842.1 class I SAM-dependent methyltransferase [Mycobacterium sp. MYCO198283]
MSRSDTDSWDLASSVGATATMVAAARALASREPEPLIVDPYAADLVRAVGMDFFTTLVDDGPPADPGGEVVRMMTGVMAVRTKFFDDFFEQSTGCAQAVILASGLDSRPYRLAWPAGTVVYELDQPQVIDAKAAAMAEIGATPVTGHRTVGVDLRDDWPAALRDAGFDPSRPTAWSAEGLLIYLPPDAQDRLFDHITALSAPGSRLATEFHPDGGGGIAQRVKAIGDQFRDSGFSVDLTQLFYDGERNPVDSYLADSGWEVSVRSRREVFADYGRRLPDSDLTGPLSGSLAVTAVRSPR